MSIYSRKKESKYTADEIGVGMKILSVLELSLKFLYQIFDEYNQQPFAIILLSAKDIDLGELIARQKRQSDILYEIDREQNLYLVICQDSKVNDVYFLINRISQAILANNGTDFVPTIIETRSTQHTPQKVALMLLDTYLSIKKDASSHENIFHILK